MAIACFVALTLDGVAAERVMSEKQVKALFLYNFAKYVTWPPETFRSPDAPFIIGILGDTEFQEALTQIVAGKNIEQRRIAVTNFSSMAELKQCHILFIPGMDRNYARAVLAKLRGDPVLTVGEQDRFNELGGAINLVKKDGKVRLEIDLRATRQGHLQVSTKLLGVADVVKGK